MKTRNRYNHPLQLLLAAFALASLTSCGPSTENSASQAFDNVGSVFKSGSKKAFIKNDAPTSDEEQKKN